MFFEKELECADPLGWPQGTPPGAPLQVGGAVRGRPSASSGGRSSCVPPEQLSINTEEDCGFFTSARWVPETSQTKQRRGGSPQMIIFKASKRHTTPILLQSEPKSKVQSN